jgi:competence protein ComEC
MGGAAGPAARWALPVLGWLAGTAAQLQLPALWSAGATLALAVAALPLFGLGWVWRGRWPGVLALAVAAAALGFAATQQRAAWRLADALPAALEGQDLVVTGIVDGLPHSTLAGTRFVFEVEQARQGDTPVVVPSRLTLGWYRGVDDDALLAGPAEDLRAGQRWQPVQRPL